MKKLVVLFSFIFVFGVSITPIHYTHAFLASGSVVNDPINTGTNFWRNTIKEVIEPIVLSVADRVLDKLTQDVVNWANGGFQGDPGFINNWDDFLRNTKHQTITGVFESASLAAISAQQSITTNNLEARQQCLLEAEVVYGPAPNCSVTQSAINNAQLCNPDDYSDIDDGDEFCETQLFAAELAHEQCISQNTDYANAVDACGSGGSFGQSATELAGQIAQQNYAASQNGDVISTRSILLAVGKKGAQELTGNDSLDQLIGGSGNTLENIENRYGVNSGVSFLATFDEANNVLGRTGLVNTGLENKIENSVKNVVDEQQTPTLFKSKKRCVEYKKNINGQRTNECAREIIGTTGDVVVDTLTNSLGIEQEKALHLSGGLVSSLIGSLGKLTKAFTTAGVSQLSSNVDNALSGSSTNQAYTSLDPSIGDFRSQYDVFGVEANGTFVTSLGTDQVETGNGLFNENGSNIFVGGPEDEDGTWNGGPEIIINFNESLESNIRLAEEEKGYFDQIDDSLSGYQNTAIELDWCNPGPDYNWEQRYEDAYRQDDNNGFGNTKEMSEDPWVNIPGSVEMRDAFIELVDATGAENARFRQRRDDIRGLVRTLNGIKDDIEAAFNTNVTEAKFENLILFNEDWETLTQDQRIQALTATEEGFVNQNGSQSNSYLIVKTEEGETIESIVTNEPERARAAVKNIAWDLWRDRTNPKEKQDLRDLFYIQEIKLSNQRFISEARSNANRVERTGSEIKKLLNDCLAFKAYALGESRDDLAIASASNFANNQTAISTSLYELNLALDLDNLVTNFFGGTIQGFAFINLNNARTNDEIKAFLESEYILFQQDPELSIFQTDTLIKTSSINNSIWRFDNNETETVSVQTSPGSETEVPQFEEQELPENEAYFAKTYPDFGFLPEIQNVLEIRNMYKYDRFYSGFNRARGLRGVLFCRHPENFDAISGSSDSTQSRCIQKDWYIGKRSQYEAIFNQFN